MALIDYVAFTNIQQKLVDQFTKFVPHDTQDSLGTLKTLMSPLNRSGFTVDQGNGKIRKVTLIHDKRLVTADIIDNSIQDCTGGAIRGDFETEFDIDPDAGKSVKGNIENSDLQRSEMDAEMWFARLVQKSMDGLEREFNLDILTTISTNFGNFATSGAATPINVKTLKTDGETQNRLFFSGIRSEFRKMNFLGTPLVVGEGLTADFFDMIPVGGQDSGDNLSELRNRMPLSFEFDENVESVIGVDEFYVIAPGAIQLLPFLAFKGPGNEMFDDTFLQTTFINPKSDIEYDVLVKFDCGVFKWQVKTVLEAKFLPLDLAEGTDKLDGVTWVNNFKVVN